MVQVIPGDVRKVRPDAGYGRPICSVEVDAVFLSLRSVRYSSSVGVSDVFGNSGGLLSCVNIVT
jgi:hypothetical protein